MRAGETHTIVHRVGSKLGTFSRVVRLEVDETKRQTEVRNALSKRCSPVRFRFVPLVHPA